MKRAEKPSLKPGIESMPKRVHFSHIPIDSGLDTPIYKQIADHLFAEISGGRIEKGTKLPTVRELAEQLGIAVGTIRRAYDELARLGGIEMKQGQGTFVVYEKKTRESRKQKAMATIDKLFSQLDELGFSPAEMDIFLDLKLRERARTQNDVRILLRCDSPELLHGVSEQIYALGGVDVYGQLMKNGAEGEGFESVSDIIVTRRGMSVGQNERDRNVFVSLMPDLDMVARLARLREDEKVGAVAVCETFLDEMLNILRRFAPNACLRGICNASASDVSRFIRGKEVIFVPEDYETLFDSETCWAIKDSKAVLIKCRIVMDEGSVFALNERLSKIRREIRMGMM